MKGCKASSVYLNQTECRGLVTTVTKKTVDFHQPTPSDKQEDSGEKHKHKRKKKKKHKSNVSDIKPNKTKPEQSSEHEGPSRSDNLLPRTGNNVGQERKKKKKHKLKEKACKIQIESQEASEYSLVGEMESKPMKLKCEPNEVTKPVDCHQPIPSDKQVDSGEKHKHKRKKKHKSNESDVKPNMDHTAKPEQSLDHEGPYRSDNLRPPRTGNSDSHERKKKKKHKLKEKACKIQIESQEASEYSLVGEMESKQMKLKCEPNDKKKRKKKKKLLAKVPCLDSYDKVDEKQNLKRKRKQRHTNGTQNKKVKLESENSSRQDDGVNPVVPGTETDENSISECHSPPKCRRDKSKKRKKQNKTFSDEIQDTAGIPTSDFADIFDKEFDQVERPNYKLGNLPHSSLIPKGKLYELGDRAISEEEQFFSVLHKYASLANVKLYHEMMQELEATNLTHFLERGRWKTHEVAQLQQNMKSFKETYPDCDPDVFLYPYMYPKALRTGAEHKRSRQDFLACISHRIRRPVQLVGFKAVSMYFDGRQGKYDPEEISLIRKYREGNSKKRYVDIATILNRRVMDVILKDKNFLVNRGIVYGKFTTEESSQLIDAVKSYKIRNNMQTDHGLGWVEIAQDVTTRSALQCYQHYHRVLRWREENQAVFKPRMSVADRIRLIEIICESNAQEEAEIDWNSLLPQFPHASSHSAVHALWYQLKLKVPDHSHKSLDEITDHLAKYELPRLQKKLERKLGKVMDCAVSSDHVDIKNGYPEAK